MSVVRDNDEARSAARPHRVLIVDDQALNRDMLGRRLERRGYDVVLRDSGVGIEELIPEQAVDLVLLDWVMPDRSGRDTLAGIRRRNDAEHMPVIVVTALDDSAVVAEALEAGANDYVTKPIDLRVLTARLGVHLERRRAVLELDAVRCDLERTVVERTQDLLTANRSLSAEISERQAAEALAQSLARRDPLTGLANRRHFMEELQRRLDRVGEDEAALALAFIDLDRFKPINDIHGHATGDELLRAIGARLSACIRNDSFAARLGGDEFVVLLEGPIDRPAIAAAAERLLAAIGASVEINGLKLAVGASIGIAICPEDGSVAAELIHRCDAAMLRAKAERGSYKFFDYSIDLEMQAKASLETELRLAIPNGEIVPHFQPVVCLASGDIVGYEVLARWPHAVQGMIPPTRFIPVAEEAGLVDSLFWTLMARACREALRVGGDFPLSVNISPSQIRDQWFPEKVLRTLRETGFPPHRLEIEVTESAMFGDLERAKAALLSLKNQGVRIALDDFGTGYSSFYLLRELPIDKLKIDCSFVGRMTKDKECATIVGALVGLGRALGLQVTAEGVEDAATAQALRGLGCEFAQGFLFGVALEQPGETTITRLAAG